MIHLNKYSSIVEHVRGDAVNHEKKWVVSLVSVPTDLDVAAYIVAWISVDSDLCKLIICVIVWGGSAFCQCLPLGTYVYDCLDLDFGFWGIKI